MEHQIGRIVNTFGIKGDIKVVSTTDFPEQRFAPGVTVRVVKDGEHLIETTIESSRQNKGSYIIHLEGFNNINEVEHFKEGKLFIDEELQHDLDDGEFYYHEIIGLKVYTINDLLIGTVKEILALDSNDVWVVQRPQPNKKDALIPYIEDVIKEIDLEKGQVIVELMEGLIEDVD